MKKISLMILLMLACTILTSKVPAQDLSEVFTQSLGAAAYADVAFGPVKEINTGSSMWSSQFERLSSFSYGSLAYRIKAGLVEVNDNLAFSANIAPSLGGYYEVNDYGYLGFNIPVYFSLDVGAGSTFNSSTNFGTYLGFGIEYCKVPLFIADNPLNLESQWTQPMVSLGLRYWNKNYTLNEIEVKIGLGSKLETNDEEFNSKPLYKQSSFTARLAFYRFINY